MVDRGNQPWEGRAPQVYGHSPERARIWGSLRQLRRPSWYLPVDYFAVLLAVSTHVMRLTVLYVQCVIYYNSSRRGLRRAYRMVQATLQVFYCRCGYHETYYRGHVDASRA